MAAVNPIETLINYMESYCSEEKSPMVRFPDSKQYKNNWKNDISLFSATN